MDTQQQQQQQQHVQQQGQSALVSVVLGDRRVTVTTADAPSSYAVVRQWVTQSDSLAELLAEHVEPGSETPGLPPLAPRLLVDAAAPPSPPPLQLPFQPSAAIDAASAAGAVTAPGGAGEPQPQLPPAEELLAHHKRHWATVRQHYQSAAAAERPRYAARLGRMLQQA